MDINIKDTKRRYDFDFTFTKDSLDKDEEISGQLTGSQEVSGRVEKLIDDKALLKFTLNGQIIYPCSRCLTPVIKDYSYPFEEEFEVNGGVIHLDDYINDCLFINGPSQILCKEDCKGLCPICGTNLNEQQCNCQEEQEDEIDPRLEKLKELL